MSMSSGCLLEPATGFAGSSMTMASSNGLACASTSDSQVSSVDWLNSLLDRAVVDPTALGGCGGGHETCLVAARLAASFHVLPDMAFSDCHLVNGSITSATHSEVSPVFWLSQWKTFSSSSVPSRSIWDMRLGLSTTYSHHCCLAFYTDCPSVYHMFQ